MFGDILGPIVSAWNASQNRNAAEDRQTQSEAFQERMSNTAYQRSVEDLTKAGLSPMIAYGGKPSVPTGGIATGGGNIEAPQIGATTLRESQAALAKEQVEVAKSTQQVNTASAEKLQAETRNIDQDTENKRLYPGMNEAQIKELISRSGQHGASAAQLNALMDEIRQRINIERPRERFATEEPEKAKWLNPLTEALNTVFKGIGALRGNSATINTTTTYPDGSKSTRTTTRK
jgi:hypothetical protein